MPGDELRGHTPPYDAPLGHDHQIVGRLLHLMQQVARHEDRPALTCEPANEGSDPAYSLGIQSVHGLVEHHGFGIPE